MLNQDAIHSKRVYLMRNWGKVCLLLEYIAILTL